MASTSSGSTVVATVVPATVQLDASPSAASVNPISLAARVAHERECVAVPAEVERQEADTRAAEAQRQHEHEVARALRGGVDCEVEARDGGERRSQAVHVVEQVEGVRDPDEPEQRDGDRDPVRADELDRQPARDRERGGGDLRTELGERGQAADVVASPAVKSTTTPSRMPPSCRVGSIAPTATARPTPANSPATMPTPPNVGVVRSCQRSPEGTATSRLPSRVWSRRSSVSAATGRATIVTAALTVSSVVKPCKARVRRHRRRLH